MIDQHVFGVLHVFLIDIVTHPEATLKVFDPQVHKLRILGDALESLIVCPFVVTGLEISRHVEVAELQVMAGMFKNNSTAGLVRVTEEEIRVPDTCTLDHQLVVIIRRMPNHKLAIKLEGSTRNVQGLLLIRCALKGC